MRVRVLGLVEQHHHDLVAEDRLPVARSSSWVVRSDSSAKMSGVKILRLEDGASFERHQRGLAGAPRHGGEHAGQRAPVPFRAPRRRCRAPDVVRPRRRGSSWRYWPKGLLTTATTGSDQAGRAAHSSSSTRSERLRKHSTPATRGAEALDQRHQRAVVEKLLHTSSTMNQLSPASGSWRENTRSEVSRARGVAATAVTSSPGRCSSRSGSSASW